VSTVGLGTYLDGDSPVHRLDPRVKVGLGALFAVGLFMVATFPGLTVMALLVVAVAATGRVPASAALRGVRAVAFVLLFTVALQAIHWMPPEALFRIGPFGVTAQGLRNGLFFAVRVIVLVVGTSLVTLTTTPVALTDAFERMMRPLARFRFPSHELAMMLSIALRFIPVTADVADQVVTAQRARGARLDRGGPLTRARAWVPVLVPLFVDLFRRADRLAQAMEARCYRGGEGRTRLRELAMRPADWVGLVSVSVLIVSVVVLSRWSW
jgi:energy-coupling factor transport system permease protein